MYLFVFDLLVVFDSALDLRSHLICVFIFAALMGLIYISLGFVNSWLCFVVWLV